MEQGENGKNLAKSILHRIEREERRRLVWRAVGCAAMLAGSVALISFGYDDLMAEAARSGLFSFVALIFSDFSAIMANFSDFAFSVAESFPVFAAAILLTGIFFAVWSIAQFMDEIFSIRKRRFN